MRTSISALHLLLVAAACTAHDQPARAAAITTDSRPIGSLGTDSTAAASALASATPTLVVYPPPPIMPADTTLRADSTGGPHMPVILPHACEGEDCDETFRAVACRAVGLRAAPSDSSAVVTELQRGDSVAITRRDLHVLRAGRVFVRRPIAIDSYTVDGPAADEKRPRADTVRFAAGDTVYLLAYSGMGSWYWWYRGKSESTEQFFAVPDDGWLGMVRPISADSRAIALSKPQTADWWLVAPRSGVTGWWRNDSSWSLRPDAHSFDPPPCPPADGAATH